jgi:hypothetical protein
MRISNKQGWKGGVCARAHRIRIFLLCILTFWMLLGIPNSLSRQHSNSQFRVPSESITIIFFSRLLRVLKCGLLFNERRGLTTGHSHSAGGLNSFSEEDDNIITATSVTELLLFLLLTLLAVVTGFRKWYQCCSHLTSSCFLPVFITD